MPYRPVPRGLVRALSILIVALALAVVAGVPSPRAASAAGDCTVDARLDSEEEAFLGLINAHRQENGRAQLVVSYSLSKASQWKSTDLATNNYFAHDDLTRSWVQRIRDCGYGFNTSLGENIAAGGATAQQAFNQWKNSSGHNQNMLSTSYTAVGIGRYFVPGSTYGWYWTTDFGGFNDGWAFAVQEAGPQVLPPAALPPPLDLWITNPAQGASYGGSVRLAVDAAGDVTRVDFYIDGRRYSRDRRAPFATRVPARWLAPGTHTMLARAFDAAGNVSERSTTFRTR
ncbi:MAG: CAP domain-containing protein [Dehalococcoidia bacterium]